jgi:hypothetical protein
MRPPTSDLSSLAAALVRREVEFACLGVTTRRALFPDTDAAFLRVGSGCAVYQGAGLPLSDAVGLGLRGNPSVFDLERVEEFYRKRDLPVRIRLLLQAERAFLPVLQTRGYRLVETINYLTRTISPMDLVDPETADVTVTPVGPKEAEIWLETLHGGFMPGTPMTDMQRRLSLPLMYRPGSQCFLAWVGGKPAGAATLSIAGAQAGLVAGSTLPEFRRRGVQTALIRTRLMVAGRAGCSWAVIGGLPGEGTQRNAERQGFHCMAERLKLELA